MTKKAIMVEKPEDVFQLYEKLDDVVTNICSAADMYIRLYNKLKEAVIIELNDKKASDKIIKATYLSVIDDICKEHF